MNRKSGFTLIELLVVIAIIAILASILFPVFAQARASARAVSCVSNEKQIGTSVNMYVQDYDETYPLGVNAAWDTTWYRMVQPYIKNIQVFRCPDDPIGKAPGWTQPYGGVRLSYVANGYLRQLGNGYKAYGVMGLDYTTVQGSGSTQGLGMSNAGVNRPAETILLTERDHVFNRQDNRTGNLSDYGPGCVFIGQAWYDWANPGELPNGTLADRADYNEYGADGGIAAIHHGKANFAFCDGHVKAMKPSATNPDPTYQPDNNMWDATRL